MVSCSRVLYTYTRLCFLCHSSNFSEALMDLWLGSLLLSRIKLHWPAICNCLRRISLCPFNRDGFFLFRFQSRQVCPFHHRTGGTDIETGERRRDGRGSHEASRQSGPCELGTQRPTTGLVCRFREGRAARLGGNARSRCFFTLCHASSPFLLDRRA